MFGVLFSIGAINALIPIIVILILIAAAAGASRGSKLFEMFGISALLGIGVGRGTIQKKSPFKTKRLTGDKSPFRKLTQSALSRVGPNIQGTLSKATMNRASNTSFKNLYGGTGLTHSGYALQELDNKIRELDSRGLSRTFTPALQNAYKNAVNVHLAVPEGRFAHEKGRILRNTSMTDAEKQTALRDLNKAHNKVMAQNLTKFHKNVEGIFANSQDSKANTYSNTYSLGLKDNLKVMQYQALNNQAKESRSNIAAIQDKINKNSTWRLRRQQEKEIQRERETLKEIRKIEAKNPHLVQSGDLPQIELKRIQNARDDYNKTIAKSGLIKNVKNLKKYHEENK